MAFGISNGKRQVQCQVCTVPSGVCVIFVLHVCLEFGFYLWPHVYFKLIIGKNQQRQKKRTIKHAKGLLLFMAIIYSHENWPINWNLWCWRLLWGDSVDMDLEKCI